MTTTVHEVALLEQDGTRFILVWIDSEDVHAFAGAYTEQEWQDAITSHPFVAERRLPVVIAFEDENGDARLFGPPELVESVASDYDWDSLDWSYTLTLHWGSDQEEE